MSCECDYQGAWIVCVFYFLTFVSVKSTPSVDVSPSHFSTTLVYGSQHETSVYLRCEVSNLEQNHRVAWFKNNRQISENGEIFRSELTDLQRYQIVEPFNLRISPITSLHAYKDTGDYQCRVLNTDDSAVARSDIVDIEINVIPGEQYPICKHFINERHFHGNKSEYFSGDNVTLQCLSDPGKPQIVLQWFRNDETTPLSTWLETSRNFNVFPINNYTLDLSTEETGTKFRCQLLQPARNCTIGPITIYDEPTINIYPEVTYVNSSDQAVTFTCSVETADPEVINYRWTVEKAGHNSLIYDSQLFNLSEYKTIKFSGFQSADSGEYNITCVVDYGFSSRDASASLIVNISSLPLAITATTLTTSVTTQQTHGFTISDHAKRPENTSNTVEDVETISLTTDKIEDDQQPTYKGQTGTIVGSIVGLLMLILLAILFVILFVFKVRKKKHKDGRYDSQGMLGGAGAANLALERREENADYANAKLSQIANTNSDNAQESVGEDGYAKLQLRGGKQFTEPEYAHLSHVTDENPGIERDLVGDDGYANLEKRQSADKTEPAYAHLSHVSKINER